MTISTYNEEFEIDLLGVIKVDSLIDLLNFFEHLFFVFFLDEGACTTSVLSQVASDWSVEVCKTHHCSADVRLLQLSLDVLGDCAHPTGRASTDSEDEGSTTAAFLTMTIMATFGVCASLRHRSVGLVLGHWQRLVD